MLIKNLTIGISISEHFSVPWGFAQAMITFANNHPEVPILTATGSLIHENRNWLVKNCKTDHMLMIDTDIVFTVADVEILLEHMQTLKENNPELAFNIITGLYKEGYPPHNYAIFDTDLNHTRSLPNIGACGMGFCLMDKKAMAGETPFDPIMDADKRHGEDVSFCIRARQRGCKIGALASVEVHHLRLRPVE